MNDRDIMQDMLVMAKSACELCLHGTIESTTPEVRCAFDTTLEDSIKMQNDIYSKMTQKGWYQTQQVEQQKIDQLKQNFTGK